VRANARLVADVKRTVEADGSHPWQPDLIPFVSPNNLRRTFVSMVKSTATKVYQDPNVPLAKAGADGARVAMLFWTFRGSAAGRRSSSTRTDGTPSRRSRL